MPKHNLTPQYIAAANREIARLHRAFHQLAASSSLAEFKAAAEIVACAFDEVIAGSKVNREAGRAFRSGIKKLVQRHTQLKEAEATLTLIHKTVKERGNVEQLEAKVRDFLNSKGWKDEAKESDALDILNGYISEALRLAQLHSGASLHRNRALAGKEILDKLADATAGFQAALEPAISTVEFHWNDEQAAFLAFIHECLPTPLKLNTG